MDGTAKAVHHHLIAHRKKPQKPATGTAQLTYYIFEGVLVGFIDSELIHISALSGGGGSSTRKRTDENVNNPYMYGLKEVDNKKRHIHVHGGPIPPGHYQVYPPSVNHKVGLSCFLDPGWKLPNERGGFFIHGPGPHGSDGCIVPPDKADFTSLMEKLKASKGGELMVCQAMDGAFA